MEQIVRGATIGCVDALVDRNVRNGLGDKEALVERGSMGRRALTYKQLLRATLSLSNHLNLETGGSRFQKNIALVGSATIELICAWLAVMRSGHLAFLLSPHQTMDHYDLLFDEFDPALVLSDRTAPDGIGERLPRIEEILALPVRGGVQPSQGWPNGLDDGRPALCLFSSGSTGLPKICVHTHKAFAHFEKTVTRAHWKLAPTDRVMATGGPFFSFGLQGIHPPLSMGATAVMVPETREHSDSLNVMEEEGVTVSLAVPTLYHLLVARAKRKYDLTKLRMSLSAGEKLPDVVRRNWERWSGARTIDSIGTTETFAPFFSETYGEDRGMTKVSGFSYRPSQIEGGGAERCTVAVAGPCMMLGYYDRWQPVGYRPIPDWFETNDIFRCDGRVWQFVSRATERIKVSGYWVSPQELDEFLLEDARVRVACTIPTTTPEGLTRLRAYIVLHDYCAADAESVSQELMRAARERLRPRALAPESIKVVSSLPSTPSGKVKREEVKAMANAGLTVAGQAMG